MYPSRVFDSRTNQTIFTGTTQECVDYMTSTYTEENEDFPYIWLENYSTGQHTQINL